MLCDSNFWVWRSYGVTSQIQAIEQYVYSNVKYHYFPKKKNARLKNIDFGKTAFISFIVFKWAAGFSYSAIKF